jgi:hypothetical protein
MLSKVRRISKHELTKSALTYLLCCQSKDFKKFNHYFDQYFAQCGGHNGENFETTKVMFETFEKLDKSVITGGNSFGGLSI